MLTVEMYRERAELFGQMRAILDAAEREGRDLTREEAETYDRLEKRLAEITGVIEREERLNAAKGRVIHAKDAPVAGGGLAEVAPVIADAMRALAGLQPRLPETRDLLSSGSALLGEPVAASFFDAVRAQQVAARAGVATIRVEDAKTRFPRVTADPTVVWLTEGTQLAASDPTIDALVVEPKTAAVLTRVSRQLLEDSDPLAERVVTRTLAGAIAAALDSAVFNGSGTAGQPRGILNTTGIGSTSLASAPTSWDPLLDAAYSLRAANFEPSAVVCHPETAGLFATLKDSTGRYIPKPDGVPQVLYTSAMPQKTVVLGDFSQVAVALRSEVRLERLAERFADYLQVGFLAHLRADVAVIRPSAFHVVTWP